MKNILIIVLLSATCHAQMPPAPGVKPSPAVFHAASLLVTRVRPPFIAVPPPSQFVITLNPPGGLQVSQDVLNWRHYGPCLTNRMVLTNNGDHMLIRGVAKTIVSCDQVPSAVGYTFYEWTDNPADGWFTKMSTNNTAVMPCMSGTNYFRADAFGTNTTSGMSNMAGAPAVAPVLTISTNGNQ